MNGSNLFYEYFPRLFGKALMNVLFTALFCYAPGSCLCCHYFCDDFFQDFFLATMG